MKLKVLLLILFICAGLIIAGCDSATDSKATNITVPELLLPENNQDSVSVTPIFRWKNPGYIIEIDDNSSFSNPEYTNNQLNGITQFVLPTNNALSNNKSYFWHVGIVSGSNTYWSAVSYKFTTKP